MKAETNDKTTPLQHYLLGASSIVEDDGPSAKEGRPQPCMVPAPRVILVTFGLVMGFLAGPHLASAACPDNLSCRILSEQVKLQRQSLLANQNPGLSDCARV